MKIKVPLRFLGMLLVAAAFLVLSRPAFSQSCALCYTQAASAGQKMIAALRSGILILVIPPTLGSVAMIFVVHRKRNQTRRVEEGNQSVQDW